MSEIQDPEVKKLIEYYDGLQDEYLLKNKENAEKWKKSPFKWLTEGVASGTKGAMGKKVISQYLKDKHFEVEDAPKIKADRKIAGSYVAIKTSFAWEDDGYKFQQIRRRDAYKLIICLGLSPFNAHLWIISREDLFHGLETGEIEPQHGGKRGTDTAWFGVNPENAPSWLNGKGGSLSEGVKVLTKLTKNNTP